MVLITSYAAVYSLCMEKYIGDALDDKYVRDENLPSGCRLPGGLTLYQDDFDHQLCCGIRHAREAHIQFAI